MDTGFTLVELLVVALITAGIAVGALVALGPLQQTSALEEAEQYTTAMLREARRRTLASDGRQSHGVAFDVDAEQVTLFAGETYEPSDGNNEVVAMPASVDLVDVVLSDGGSSVVFERLEGGVQASGTVTFRSRRGGAERTVSITTSGQVARSPATPSGVGRVTDTRHVHFDLGWSIQGGGTLELVFFDPPNADVLEVIDMNCCYSADQSAFDWEGSVDVYGEEQHLRIHTHLLSSNNTILSLHRDRRENTKALRVHIQDRDIVEYAADGTMTVLSFGGEEEIQ